MKTPRVVLFLFALLLAPFFSFAQEANAPRAGGGRGAQAANHIEIPATGAIWMPSPDTNRIGIYPYGADSVVHDGVPQGTFEKFTHTSKIVYPGVMRRVWIYVPAQYDPKVPACLMVVQDGVMQYAGRVADRTHGHHARIPRADRD